MSLFLMSGRNTLVLVTSRHHRLFPLPFTDSTRLRRFQSLCFCNPTKTFPVRLYSPSVPSPFHHPPKIVCLHISKNHTDWITLFRSLYKGYVCTHTFAFHFSFAAFTTLHPSVPLPPLLLYLSPLLTKSESNPSSDQLSKLPSIPPFPPVCVLTRTRPVQFTYHCCR